MKFEKTIYILFIAFVLIALNPAFSVSDAVADTSETAIEDFEDESTDSDFSDSDFEDAPSEDSDFSDDDFSDGDDFDDDFSDDEQTATIDETSLSSTPATTSLLPSFIAMKGYLKLTTNYNTDHDKPIPGQMDWRGLSKLRTELFLETGMSLHSSWRLKFSGNVFYDAAYDINDRDEATDEVIDEYEAGGELKKAWIEGKVTDWFDIKAGRQIVVWGKSDSQRVTDILNPINLQEPRPANVEDLDNLRLPALMTRLDFFKGDWNLTAIAIHEHRFNKIPEFGSDFYPNPAMPPPEEIKPSNHISNTEFAVSLMAAFSGWDLSFYFADLYNNESHIVIDPWYAITLEHSRIKMAGADVNVAYGNWLFKTEGAFFSGIRLNDALMGTTIIRLSQNNHNRIKTMGGVEYSGIKDTTLSVEVMNDHVQDIGLPEKSTGVEKNTLQATARASRNFMNERLEVVATLAVFGEKADEGSMYRFTAEYEITDNLLINGGMIFYEGGNNPILESFKNNDRIAIDIKYSF